MYYMALADSGLALTILDVKLMLVKYIFILEK